jgi:hypothetical protein
VQHGTDYKFLLSAIDYSEGKVEIKLTGISNEDEVFDKEYVLGHSHTNVTIDVSFVNII